MEAVDRARLAEIRAWLSPGVLDVPPQWADKLAFLLRLLDKREADIARLTAPTETAKDRAREALGEYYDQDLGRTQPLGRSVANAINAAENAARAAALEEAAKIANCDCPIGRETRWCGPRCQRQTSIAIRDIANADNQH